jgi:hypothetical protein
MNNKRLGIEAIVIVLLALAILGVWWWRGHVAENEVTTLRTTQEEEVRALRNESSQWAGRLATGEAEAVFRAFAAGIAQQVLPGGDPNLDQAVGGLLELPGVAFVHVLGPDGTVLATSDRKLSVTGRAGDDARWALESTDLVTRASRQPGVTELAAPIVGSAGAAGYLWMGYETQRRLEDARPPSLGRNRPDGADEGTGGEGPTDSV